MDPHPFPLHLDKPQRLLLWEADEVIPAMACMAFGILLEQILFFLALAVISIWFFRKFRNAKPNGYLIHALYWYGFAPLRGRAAINPFQRRVLPS